MLNSPNSPYCPEKDRRPAGHAISRRSFLRKTAAAIAAVGTAGALAASEGAIAHFASPEDDINKAYAADSPKDLEILDVAEDAVFTTEQCEFIEDASSVSSVSAQASLPYGTMVWADDDNVAACLLPCETSSPLAQVGLLWLSDGSMETVLEEAVGHSEGFEIYNVRANSHGAIWTEADILNGEWRLYAAKLENGGLASPQVVAEGTSEWETPSIAVSDNFAFWQIVPRKEGPRSEESSLLMRASFGSGSDDAKVVYESKGRFACPLSGTADGVTIAPRADVSGTYYQLVQISADSGQAKDTLSLPSSMKPAFISYGSTGFSFAFDSIYSLGGGISNLGTYTPANGDTSGTWFRFPRTPVTTPAWTDGFFVVKSTSVVACVDLEAKRYFTIQPENATQGYGEFLASSGACNRVVTYSNIDYTPINGERICECNVRVWSL